jgi:ribosomal protein L11 methyltransferase
MRDDAGDRDAQRRGMDDATRAASGADMQATRHWSLSVRVARERVEQLGAHLLQLGFSAFEEQGAPGGARLLVYSEREQRLRDVARELSRAADLGAVSCEIAELGTEWQLAWTRHLEPVELTANIRLVPGAPGGAPEPNVLYLEPAFAFGFGEHASTRLIAAWLEAACRQRPGASVLDAGTGTGVLAFVAARSGAARVIGIDTSLQALQAAGRNAVLNHISNVHFVHASVAAIDGCFDIVAANIEATVLLALRGALAERVTSGGGLALSGLIEEQADDVIVAYAEAGVHLERVAREGEWCLLATR